MGRRKKGLIVVLLLALAGLVSSIYLANLHYLLLSGSQVGGSFCALSDLVDCDAVTASTYAEVYYVPLAAIGAVVYLLCISFALIGIAIPRLGIFAARLVFPMVLISVLFDAYLAFIGFAVLRKICLVCIFTWAVNLGMLYFSFKGSEGGIGEIACGVARELRALASGRTEDVVLKRLHMCTNGVIILFSALVIGLLRLHYVSGPEQIAARVIESFRDKSPAAISVVGAPRQGNPNARLQIVEFSDFRCPFCKKMAPVVDAV